MIPFSSAHSASSSTLADISDLKPGWQAHLRAINPERNVYRFYSIYICQDLFGDITVITNYGRIGTYGTLRSYWPESLSALQTFVTKNLRKRLHAHRRIGCGYKYNDCSH